MAVALYPVQSSLQGDISVFDEVFEYCEIVQVPTLPMAHPVRVDSVKLTTGASGVSTR
jgi:hypothetical protein